MHELTCPGLPASWLNAWLAAVGATVLDSRIRLRWTTEGGTPVAVLSAKEIDPVTALAGSWPEIDELADMPIAERWKGTPPLPRKVSVGAFISRARATRSHNRSWTLSSTMTDLDVDKNGEVAHAPLDPAGPGTIKWLHHRLLKVHHHVEPSAERLQESFMGAAARVNDNGLGFDLSRMGSQSDASGMAVDPVIEVLAFFGLALLPVRGAGIDRSTGSTSYSAAIQRGWRRTPGRRLERRFMWPVWADALDHAGVDALLDIWKPNERRGWQRLGVHAAWQSVRFEPRASADATRAFGSERL